MALQVGSRLGPYEVTALIGAGGMGEVYRARDTKLDRDVALKVPQALPPIPKDSLGLNATPTGPGKSEIRPRRETMALGKLIYEETGKVTGYACCHPMRPGQRLK